MTHGAISGPEGREGFDPLRGSFGERLGAIEWAAAGYGKLPLRQVICESDTSCAAPERHDLPFLADAGGFGGVINDDELVFFEAAAGAATGSIRSCTKASMLAGPCVPSTLATGLPLPRAWASKIFEPAHNASALFYVDVAGRILRIAL